MEKNTRLNEFLAYLNSFEKPNGYDVQYRLCGFRGTSENGDVYCLAVKFLSSGEIESECKFADGWNGLEFRCNQPEKKSL